MGKIAFFCIPAQGHTNPTLGVVKELVAMGHEVWYYSYDALKEKIISTGAKYISCDPYDIQMTLRPEDTERISTDIAFSMEILVNTTLALDDAILADMKAWKPDCIVADSMAVWGKLVALKLQVPFVSSTTTFAFNKYAARIMKQSGKELLHTIFSIGRANKVVKKLRDKGYPVKNALSVIANDNSTNTIVYTSPEFQPCADTFSSKYSFVGPSIRFIGAQIEEQQAEQGKEQQRQQIEQGKELESEKQKVIYVSLGTVNNNNLTFFENCIKALGGTEYRVIMSVGTRISIEALGEIPKNIEVKDNVDQIAVLQEADAFITHCGMNSVNEALYYDVPLILYPQTKEQEGVARRVYDMGAGIYLENCDANDIIEVVEEILKNPNYKRNAQVIADSFKRCGGAKQAAKKIVEQFAG